MAKRKQSNTKKKQTRSTLRSWSWLFKLLTVFMVLGVAILIYLDAQIRHRFEGHRWSLPAKVYARPLELYQGYRFAQGQLDYELKQLGYRFVKTSPRVGQVQRTDQGMVIHSRDFRFADGFQEGQQVALNIQDNTVSALTDEQAQEVDLFRLEPQLVGGIYPTHNEDRELLRLNDLPNGFIETLVAVEDRAYFTHHGVSFSGILRAMWANLKAGSIVQGGSTLTQQLVKNFYLTDRQSLLRKAIEAPMALLLNLHYSKEEVLEVYLNEVFLGQSGKRAIHGFGLASKFYFGQPLSELKLHQVALLVGMIKGPSYYNPKRHPERAIKRRNLVLAIVANQGLISEAQKQSYQNMPLDLSEATKLSSHPAYMDAVRQQLHRHYKASALSNEGLKVFTSLDPWVQYQADQAMVDQLNSINKTHNTINSLQGALVVSHRDSGELLALVGDNNGGYAGHNFALDPSRQVGSLLKPVIHMAALESGRYELSSMIDDAPISLAQADGLLWQPQNYDKKSHGRVPMYETLTRSYNQANVRLGLEVGLESVLTLLEGMGIEQNIPAYPSVLLGAVEMSPWQVNQVYQTIAGGGFYSPIRIVRQVTKANGELLSHFPFEIRQVASNESVYRLDKELEMVAKAGTGAGVYNYLPNDQLVAGKTGTTNDQRDSWFAGYSGEYVATVWLGREDMQPTPLTGASGALKVWGQLVQSLPYRPYTGITPENISYHVTHPQTGAIIPSQCENGVGIPVLNQALLLVNQTCGY